jgi:NDP-sugar pyrophosphorylase family protein
MQCVILAAGKGTRLRPLTEDKPKQLVTVSGKPLIEYIVEALPSAIDELIIVIGYRGDMIREYCGNQFHGKKVTYVEQPIPEGTARALWLCKDLLTGRFLFMFGDDIHGRADIARAVSYSRSMLAKTSDTPERFGVLVRNPDGTLFEIIEKPTHPPSNLVSTGVMVLDVHIFAFEPQAPVNGEYYLTEVIERYAKEYPLAVVEEDFWIPIGYPEDIQKAEVLLSTHRE